MKVILVGHQCRWRQKKKEKKEEFDPQNASSHNPSNFLLKRNKEVWVLRGLLESHYPNIFMK